MAWVRIRDARGCVRCPGDRPGSASIGLRALSTILLVWSGAGARDRRPWRWIRHVGSAGQGRVDPVNALTRPRPLHNGHSPTAGLPGEELMVQIVPAPADEFRCRFLVRPRCLGRQTAESTGGTVKVNIGWEWTSGKQTAARRAGGGHSYRMGPGGGLFPAPSLADLSAIRGVGAASVGVFVQCAGFRAVGGCRRPGLRGAAAA